MICRRFFGWRAGRDIKIARQLGQVDAAELPERLATRAKEVQLLDDLARPTTSDPQTASAAAHALVAGTPSQIMLVQADDLSGETDPLNVPGTDREWPNWRRRVHAPVEQLAQSPLATAILGAVKKERR